MQKNKVVIDPYSPEWAIEFKKEKRALETLLKGHILAIEHIGRTSIPELSAKPIIDIAVAVQTKDRLYDLIPILSKNGYDVMDSIETKGEVLARKGPPECRTHYIHIEVIESTFWRNHILFRDYLLAHPESVKQYELLKKDISKKYKDERKKYTAAKNEFIQDILNKMNAWILIFIQYFRHFSFPFEHKKSAFFNWIYFVKEHALLNNFIHPHAQKVKLFMERLQHKLKRTAQLLQL